MTTLTYKNQKLMGLLARNSKAPIMLLILSKCAWDNEDFRGNKNTAASIRCAYQTTQTGQENRDLMAMNDCAIQKRPVDLIIWAKPTVERFIFGAL